MTPRARNRPGDLTLLLLLALSGCGPVEPGADPDAGEPPVDAGGADAFAGWRDFPAEPLLGDGVPPGIDDLFGDSVGAGGPCLLEPAIGALYPRDHTAPVFEWADSGAMNVYELRLHVDGQLDDLRVYTMAGSFTLPEPMWRAVADHSGGQAVQVAVRGARLAGTGLAAGPFAGSSGEVHIAPVGAAGAVVYWMLKQQPSSFFQSTLEGYQAGRAGLTTVLTPPMMGMSESECIGCHTSSPDGEHAFVTRQGSSGGGAFSIDVRAVDGSGERAGPEVATEHALALLARGNQTMPAVSPAHYDAGDAVVLSILEDASTVNLSEIIYTDLRAEDGGSGVLQRTGDDREAGTPSFSHDGLTIAYVSARSVIDGYAQNDWADPGAPDIRTVPYGDRAGGDSVRLAGASDPEHPDFYPTYSPGDVWLAFNRSFEVAGERGENGRMYHAAGAELFVVPAAGGTAVRLAANDPPACSGAVSPGVTNSWPRWAPAIGVDGDHRYYWLVFSSTRRGEHPQLYVAGLETTVTELGEVIAATYPAVSVTNQRADEGNHTPAWDAFQIIVP